MGEQLKLGGNAIKALPRWNASLVEVARLASWCLAAAGAAAQWSRKRGSVEGPAHASVVGSRMC